MLPVMPTNITMTQFWELSEGFVAALLLTKVDRTVCTRFR